MRPMRASPEFRFNFWSCWVGLFTLGVGLQIGSREIDVQLRCTCDIARMSSDIYG